VVLPHPSIPSKVMKQVTKPLRKLFKKSNYMGGSVINQDKILSDKHSC
jgi:hypothetical protein